MATISSSWNANDVVYYSEGGGSKWDERSLHIQLTGEDVAELPVRVKVYSGSEPVNREHYEWRIVDTQNRTMDEDSRRDTGFKFTGTYKDDDPHYFFFVGMVIDIHLNRTITQRDSAYVSVTVGSKEIKSPPFLCEKSRDSHRKRLETIRKKSAASTGASQQPSRKKRRVAVSKNEDDETSSEEDSDNYSDSDDDSDVETENKAIQCDVPWSTEDLKRMLRAREGEEVSSEDDAAASSPNDSPVPGRMEEEHGSGGVSSGDSGKGLSPISPDRRSILSSPMRSRASSFELLGSSFDHIAGIPMSPSIISSGNTDKLMEMLVENQKQLISIVANGMAPST